jgi:hypothetical protein
MPRRITRPFVRLVAPVLVGVGLLVAPASALGQATVTPISDSFEFGPVLGDDTSCAGPGFVGTLRGTGTATGHMVETDGHFHLDLTIRTQVRIEFPDGSYVLESQREGLVFNATEPHFTVGGTTHAKGTLYDANGTVRVSRPRVPGRLPR